MIALELTLLLCILANGVVFVRLLDKWRQLKYEPKADYEAVAQKAVTKYRAELRAEIIEERSITEGEVLAHTLYKQASQQRYISEPPVRDLTDCLAQLGASYGAQNVAAAVSLMPTGCDQDHSRYWLNTIQETMCSGCGAKTKSKCMCKGL